MKGKERKKKKEGREGMGRGGERGGFFFVGMLSFAVTSMSGDRNSAHSLRGRKGGKGGKGKREREKK